MAATGVTRTSAGGRNPSITPIPWPTGFKLALSAKSGRRMPPTDVIRLYGLRFKIELSFDQALRVLSFPEG